MTQLSETQKRHLRRLGHDLKPVVRTGSNGLTDAVMNEIAIALRDHELMKVKLVADDRAQRRAFLERILEECDAMLVQAVGHTALIYRSNPKKTHRIALP
ncbi:MAG TPA: ribosome assembly RNA-binding protein YhbY [Gammaproteobacteria bacterium]|nr:ribosome assembly RNA-binding protein YhbY [Gammaproteobacteria bacterium]